MAGESANGAAGVENAAAQMQFNLQKIYVKDASFEAPNAPAVFQEEGQPQLQLNLAQKVNTLAENVFEVVLTVTLTNNQTGTYSVVQNAPIRHVDGDNENDQPFQLTY